MQKTRDFLRDLQQNLFISCFTDSYFKSIVTIPKLELYKCKKSKCWLTRVLLFEELFDYQYPFIYPDLFETESIKFNKDQYSVPFNSFNFYKKLVLLQFRFMLYTMLYDFYLYLKWERRDLNPHAV